MRVAVYPLARRLLFSLPPEAAHRLTLGGLRCVEHLSPSDMAVAGARACHVMGLRFPNPVGLSAGLDKNGDYLDALGRLGFGFIELGTVTPRAQSGNPRPRLFRLPRSRALINRLGFNNRGVDYLVDRVRRRRYSGVLGINIGKNRNTPLEHAVDDYCYCLERVYAHADYIVVNISSPNTPGLRTLQYGDQFTALLRGLTASRRRLEIVQGRYVPLVVKVAPEMDYQAIDVIAQGVLEHGIDGVAATNTTLSREGVEGQRHAEEEGGLSGPPMRERATAMVHNMHTRLLGRVPLIGVGGIASGGDALAKREAGASLVQLYTGLIYRGPALVAECVNAWQNNKRSELASEGRCGVN